MFVERIDLFQYTYISESALTRLYFGGTYSVCDLIGRPALQAERRRSAAAGTTWLMSAFVERCHNENNRNGPGVRLLGIFLISRAARTS